MGNRLGGVTERLEEAIRTDSVWADMLVDPQSRLVDFDPDNVRRQRYNREVFEPEMMSRIPSTLELVVLFPGQQDVGKRVMRGSQYRRLDLFNRELNRRMDRSDPKAIQAAFCWTDYIYRVTGVQGNLYLAWAREVSIYRDDDVEIDKVGRDLPLLVATDGHFDEQAFYPLIAGSSSFEVLFMPAEQTHCVRASDDPIYPCDVPRPSRPAPPVGHLTENEARIRRERRVVPVAEKLDVPGHGNNDNNDDDDDADQDDWVVEPYNYGSGNRTNDDSDDDVAEFFSVAAGEELPTVEDRVMADLGHFKVSRYVSSDAEIVAADGDNDNDGGGSGAPLSSPGSQYLRPPDTVRRRNLVPRSLLPQSKHRTACRVVQYRPREIAYGSPSPSCSSDYELTPPTSDTQRSQRPSGVAPLQLEGIAPQ